MQEPVELNGPVSDCCTFYLMSTDVTDWLHDTRLWVTYIAIRSCSRQNHCIAHCVLWAICSCQLWLRLLGLAILTIKPTRSWHSTSPAVTGRRWQSSLILDKSVTFVSTGGNLRLLLSYAVNKIIRKKIIFIDILSLTIHSEWLLLSFVQKP